MVHSRNCRIDDLNRSNRTNLVVIYHPTRGRLELPRKAADDLCVGWDWRRGDAHGAIQEHRYLVAQL